MKDDEYGLKASDPMIRTWFVKVVDNIEKIDEKIDSDKNFFINEINRLRSDVARSMERCRDNSTSLSKGFEDRVTKDIDGLRASIDKLDVYGVKDEILSKVNQIREKLHEDLQPQRDMLTGIKVKVAGWSVVISLLTVLIVSAVGFALKDYIVKVVVP